MTTVAEKVLILAEDHRVTQKNDYASYLANEVNRLEGIEADEILELIGALMEANVLTNVEGVELILGHHRETSEQSISESVVL